MDIIDSDDFLELPVSSQNLYFHLSMRADDEGFIDSQKRIMRMIGANEDELKLLVAKSFIILFESGVIVIKHWKMHNYIQKDRFKNTMHSEERTLLSTTESNVYTMDTRCVQDVRVGKVRLDNNMLQKEADEVFEKIWKKYYQEKMKPAGRRGGSKSKARVNFDKLLKKNDIDSIMNLVAYEYSLKLGVRDLERVLTDASMKDYKGAKDESKTA
jgi:hypothetical protein